MGNKKRTTTKGNKFAMSNESLLNAPITDYKKTAESEAGIEEPIKDIQVEESKEVKEVKEESIVTTTVEEPAKEKAEAVEEKIIADNEVTEVTEKPKKKVEPKKTEAKESDLMKELAANKKDRGIAKTTYYTKENYNKLLEIEKKTGASFSSVVNKILKSVLENM